MYVNCTARVEDDTSARNRRLGVLRQLREYNDPQLWGSVSSLVLEDGELDLDGVIEDTEDVETLEWCLTSCVGKDLLKLW